MFTILIITFTISRCFSSFRDYAETPGLLKKTAEFLPPEEIVRLQRTYRLARTHLIAMRFAPSPIILTASQDNTAKLWNAETGQLIRSFESHNRPVRSAVFSKDGDRILTSSFDNTAKLWNAKTGQLILSLESHIGSVWSATFSDTIIKFE